MTALSLTFENTSADGHAALMAVAGFLECAGAYSANIELALAESINNIVDHAYDATGTATLDICALPTAVHCVLQDCGRVFDPATSTSKTDGGFGWGLIQKVASKASLQRIEDTNHLTLEFRHPA
ncbi:MAG: ATP-binding protein [Planktomarina sp.]